MPPLVAAAAITGIAAITSSVASSRAASSASKRAITSQNTAAAKAEAFEREQDEKNRADAERVESEDRRRWDTEQQNLASERAERDARQAYEDKIRYRKMVNLARLTGGPTPDPLPNFGGGGGAYSPNQATYAAPGAPILARPSTANAMIAAPGAQNVPFDPFTDTQRNGWPLSAVSRRRVI